MPYLIMKDMNRFIKKLEKYFKDQPSQLKKIIKSLTELSENSDITMDAIKGTVLPLLKGNAALTDWFLQIFPSEHPPSILSNGPHEVIDISKELARQRDEEIFETVVLPDTEDPYGGSSCICPCHNVEDNQFKARLQHCTKCGVKFIQGKIYIQVGKALRPAVVSFLTNPEKDHSKRLTATQRKRSENSPNKQSSSPTKETPVQEEIRNSNESDEDCEGNKKKKKFSKNSDKPKPKHRHKIKREKDTGKSVKTSDKAQTSKSRRNVLKKAPRKRRKSVKKSPPEHKPGSTVGQQKRLAEEETQIDYSAPAEFVELKVSSDHSGESESEFFESSQDVTNTDSDDLSDSSTTSPAPHADSGAQWSRNEDKIILQTFKQSSNNEETFEKISKLLPNRSVAEIKCRFHKLMSLLKKMAEKPSSVNNDVHK